MVTVQQSTTPDSRSLPAVATVAVATVGLGLNLKAWVLLGPHLHERFDVTPGTYVLLVGLPLLVAAVVRLPVGVLTDRYGARVMYPVVSLVAAGSVVGLGLAGSLPAVIVAGAAAGIAGAAFVVGAALLSRALPYGRRGLALGVFSLGPALGVVTSVLSRGFDSEGRRAALVLGGLLVCFAGLAALVLRDHAGVPRAGSPLRRCVEMIRLASTTSLSLLYALALGGLVATAVFLPVYLATAFGLHWFDALAVTGVVVGLAAAARLVGGWWTDRRPTAQLLIVCYAVAAALCLVVALAPRQWWLTVPAIAAIAGCDGVASGALFALIGKAARADHAGAVMGVTGAAAALGAVLLPLLMAGVDRLTGSRSGAWVLLGAALLAASLYVRAHRLRIGLGLAVRFEPAPSATAMTVAVVGGSDTRFGAAAVVARLAELAASDELIVVYGSDEPWPPVASGNVLVTGLRDRLPRCRVVAIDVPLHNWARGRLAMLLHEFLDAGTIAVAVTAMADLRGLAAQLSSYLEADRVLMISYSLARGADLHEVWNRGMAATNGS
ncbi:MAG: transporter, family, nitrate/nitrite transporter [Micromonosporaceae bacterium]